MGVHSIKGFTIYNKEINLDFKKLKTIEVVSEIIPKEL